MCWFILAFLFIVYREYASVPIEQELIQINVVSSAPFHSTSQNQRANTNCILPNVFTNPFSSSMVRVALTEGADKSEARMSSLIC